MKTEVYFENILFQFIRELRKASDSIIIAVAWFTDPELYDVLKDKIEVGVKIELMILDDELNRGAFGLDFSSLSAKGAKVYFIKRLEEEGPLMHHKFCIIDGHTSITGSYNWSRRARKNEENIIVFKEGPEVYNKFFEEFSRLKIHYNVSDNIAISRQNQALALGKIIHRFEAISNLIELKDYDLIDYQLEKVKNLVFDRNDPVTEKVKLIIGILENNDFQKGLEQIQEFKQGFREVSSKEQIELPKYEFEQILLESQIASLEEEISEVQRRIRSFEVRYYRELGALIEQILDLKRKIFKETGQNEREEAANRDYDNFQETNEKILNKNWQTLSEEGELELKSLFKKSCKLCHPDLVEEKFKEEASATFISLREAYASNDLEEVRRIHENLINGFWLGQGQDTVSKLTKLKRKVEELNRQKNKLVEELKKIKQSRTYKLIVSILDWDKYFSETKKQMEKELEHLENYEPINTETEL